MHFLLTKKHPSYLKLLLFFFLFVLNYLCSYAKLLIFDTITVRGKYDAYLIESIYVFNHQSNLIEYQTKIWKDGKIYSGNKYVFVRNDQEVLTQTYFYNFIDNNWIVTARETKTYDEDGLLVEKLMQIFKEEKWINDTRNFITYNQKKLIETDCHQKWNNTDWVNQKRIVYIYNNQDLKEMDYHQVWDGIGWVYQLRNTYKYNEKGYLISHLSENIVSNEWVYDYRYTKNYDEKGNLLENKYEKWSNWKLIDYWKYNYTYYPDNKVETTIYEKFVKESFVPIFKFHYVYDANNNIKQQIEYSWRDVEWIGKERITNNYNKNSLLLSSVYEKIWNNEWVEYRRITNHYNSENKIFESFEETYGTQWTPLSKEIYEYNQLGNEILWKKQIIFSDELVDKYKIVTNYDEDGFLTEIISLQYDINTWKWDSVNAQRPFTIKDSLNENKYNGFYLKASYKTGEKTYVNNFHTHTIFPNPATSFINLNLKASIPYAFLFDERGVIVKLLKLDDSLNQIVDISDLKHGLYFIIVGNQSFKFIKK